MGMRSGRPDNASAVEDYIVFIVTLLSNKTVFPIEIST